MGQTTDDRYYIDYKRGIKEHGSHEAFMDSIPKHYAEYRDIMERISKMTYCERHFGMKCKWAVLSWAVTAATVTYFMLR